MIRQQSSEIPRPNTRGRRHRPSRRQVLIRRAIAGAVALLIGGGVVLALRGDPPTPPQDVRGSSAWAFKHYGNADAPGFKARNIVTIDFLGRTMFVHRKVQRHFLRLERIFAARAPEYAATIAAGTLDDWSYENRAVRGEANGKSNHAFGLAIDVNALTNVLGTTGDIPMEVVRQWEIEGGDWGGDWTRPDPMHFESHLTPSELRRRYQPDGDPRDWYLQELVGG